MKANSLINIRITSFATLVLVVFMLLASSCRSKKGVASPIDNSKVNREVKKDVFKAIVNNRFEFEYFSTSASCDYSGAAVPLTVSLRMQRDKKIWASVSAIFFEVARVLITEDSVHIINYGEKYIMSRKIDFLATYTGTQLTVGQIQDVLVGNSVFAHDNNSSLESVEEDLKITTRIKQYLLQEVFSANHFRPTKINADETGTQNQLEVIYNDYSLVNARLVPQVIKIKAVTNTQDMMANLKYSDISTATITDWPFRVPANYERK